MTQSQGKRTGGKVTRRAYGGVTPRGRLRVVSLSRLYVGADIIGQDTIVRGTFTYTPPKPRQTRDRK